MNTVDRLFYLATAVCILAVVFVLFKDLYGSGPKP